MSRIGKQLIAIPEGVKVNIDKEAVVISGSKGELSFNLPHQINVVVENNAIIVKRENDTKPARSLHGTVRALLNNMVEGVSKGFKKELSIIGVGYKAQLKGNTLILNIGFSHLVEMSIPSGVKVSLSNPTSIAVEGIDKQMVGEFAAEIRMLYPPEPYKGKGIRYMGEEVRKKLGKALAK